MVYYIELNVISLLLGYMRICGVRYVGLKMIKIVIIVYGKSSFIFFEIFVCILGKNGCNIF